MAILNSLTILPPPTTGQFDYNTWKPGASGFPAAGGTYVDPVFGETVRRITNVGAVVNDDECYAHHWINADNTLCFLNVHSFNVLSILNTTTGAVAYANQPAGTSGFDIMWDPLDADKYYYFSGNSIVRRNLAAQTNTTMHTFSAGALGSLGGSHSWCDGTGTVFTVMIGGALYFWNKTTNVEYTGGHPPCNPPSTNGYATITPSGKYAVVAQGGVFSCYLLNNVAGTCASTPIIPWQGLGGDHAAFASASNGHEYCLTFDFNSIPGLWRVDLEIPHAAGNFTGMHNDNLRIVDLNIGGVWQTDGHMTGSFRGANQNWVYWDEEITGSTDPFNGGVSGWWAYKSEIVAINLVTLDIYRLAHHRSRGLPSSYWNQPRISSSWDGTMIMWDSNYNISTPTGYNDRYLMAFNPSGGSDTTPPSAPTGVTVT